MLKRLSHFLGVLGIVLGAGVVDVGWVLRFWKRCLRARYVRRLYTSQSMLKYEKGFLRCGALTVRV